MPGILAPGAGGEGLVAGSQPSPWPSLHELTTAGSETPSAEAAINRVGPVAQGGSRCSA